MKVRVPESVLSQQLGPDTVLLNLKTSTYFGVEGAGARIWELLKAGEPLSDIYARLVEEYEAPGERLAKDLRKFVDALKEEGLLDDG